VTSNVSYGVHAVRVLLTRSPDRVRKLWLQGGKEGERLAELRELASRRGIQIAAADPATLDKLAANGRHQGAVAEVAVRTEDPETLLEVALESAAGPPLLLVLDGVQDPHNLGACLRTADAAQATAVIAPRDRASGLTPVVRKVASGAAEALPFVAVVNLARTLRELKDRNVWIVGTGDRASKSLYDVDLRGPIALVMGGEADGLRRLTREVCDELVSSPMAGVVESLNVSVAAGVALFEAVRQRRGTAPAKIAPRRALD
jgi:23S rRNA (guanosine2251-2'-O)-methyltransferase